MKKDNIIFLVAKRIVPALFSISYDYKMQGKESDENISEVLEIALTMMSPRRFRHCAQKSKSVSSRSKICKQKPKQRNRHPSPLPDKLHVQRLEESGRGAELGVEHVGERGHGHGLNVEHVEESEHGVEPNVEHVEQNDDRKANFARTGQRRNDEDLGGCVQPTTCHFRFVIAMELELRTSLRQRNKLSCHKCGKERNAAWDQMAFLT